MASESKSGGAAAASAGGAQKNVIALHPMTLLSVADHHTRIMQGQTTGHTRAVGILFGTQTEDGVDVIMAADSLATTEEGKVGFNLSMTKEQVQLSCEVYPTYEVLGWYAVCMDGKPSEADFAFHSQVKAYNEAPLFLALDATPQSADTMKELPVALFNSEFQGGKETWVQLKYKVDALDAESLTVEAVLGAGREKDALDSELNQHLGASIKAVRIARERMGIVRSYVAAVAEGRVEADQELLRQCRAVANQLPGADGDAFQAALASELVDSQVITLLSALTRAADAANGALDKLGTATAGRAAARTHGGGGMFGDFMA